MVSLGDPPLPQDGGDEGRCPVVRQTSCTVACCWLGAGRHVHHFPCKIPSKPWPSDLMRWSRPSKPALPGRQLPPQPCPRARRQ